MFASLAEHGLREDTIVVFASDHGDNLGSHGLFNKGKLIEEENLAGMGEQEDRACQIREELLAWDAETPWLDAPEPEGDIG